jgi:glycine cleavage system transcriptional repressor
LKKVLITVLGQDQLGILAAVSTVIFTRGGNIENLSQTLLQTTYGSLLIVTIPDTETPQALQTALIEACAKLQLIIHVDPAFVEAAPSIKPDTQPYIVVALGPDRRGLVSEVSTQLAGHDVNITNMQAIFKGGSKPLDNMMVFEVDVPRHANMQALREALKEISSRLALEISIQHRKIFESVSRIQN